MSNYFEEKELLEKRASVHEDMKTILATAKEEGRELTEEERTKFNKADKDFEKLTGQINDIQKVNEREKALDEKAEERSEKLSYQTGKRVSGDELKDKQKREEEVFDKALRSKSMGQGLSWLTSEEREIAREFQNHSIENPYEQRAQSAGTDSSGGFTVPQGFSNQLYESLKAFGGARQTADIIQTETGNQIDWPTNDDTSNSGALLAENTQVSEQDLTFANKNLDAFKYTSKLIRVSRELIQDTAFDFQGLLRRKLSTRLGRITNTHYTTGTGSSQPQGFVHAAGLGQTTGDGSGGGGSTSFDRADILELIHSVDPAYRASGMTRHTFSDATLKEVKILSVGSSDDRPLWQPSMRVGEPDTIEGFGYVVNQDIDDANTSGNQFWFFGDWDAFKIRDVLDVTLLVLTERYADFFQTGFVAFMRTDSELMDSSAVKYMRNSTT